MLKWYHFPIFARMSTGTHLVETSKLEKETTVRRKWYVLVDIVLLFAFPSLCKDLILLLNVFSSLLGQELRSILGKMNT